MNETLKSALLFVGGALLGAAGGYFFTKKKYDTEFQKELDIQVEAYKDQASKITAAYTQLLNEVTGVAVDCKDDEQIEEAAQVESKIATPVDYAAIAPKAKPDPRFQFQEVPDEDEETEEPSEEEIDAAIQPAPKMEHDKPYVISEEDYYDMGNSGFDKCPLVLYSDGALAEETTDDLVDTYELVGRLIKDMPKVKGSEMFVANEWLGTVYEIIYDDRTYEDATGGHYYGE